jgi:hypothetical protein
MYHWSLSMRSRKTLSKVDVSMEPKLSSTPDKRSPLWSNNVAPSLFFMSPNHWKSEGAKSGEYGGWFSVVMHSCSINEVAIWLLCASRHCAMHNQSSSCPTSLSLSHSAPGKAGQFGSCLGHLRVAPPSSTGRRQFSDSSIETIAVTFWHAEGIPTKKWSEGKNAHKKLRRYNSNSSHRAIFTDQQKPRQTTEALR